MSKIICDVCGTSYAESADQCPICGTAKTEASRPADTGETGYAYVKGGRFSQANVRKHNSGQRELPRTMPEEKPAEPKAEAPKAAEPKEDTPKPVRERRERNEVAAKETERPARRVKKEEPADEQPSNIGLIIIVVVLLVAIIAVCAYIGMYAYDKFSNKPTEPSSSTSSSTVAEDIPCEQVTVVGLTDVTISNLNGTHQLELAFTPANTTEDVRWEYNAALVSVEQQGNYWYITAIAPGETDVTVYCGNASATIHVNCDFVVDPEPSDPTDPTDPEPTDPTNPTDPSFILEWACADDITLSGYGANWRIYNGTVDVSEITFTSSNEAVATVQGNRVYIWSNGTAIITATYGNQTITMTVRATKVEPPEEGKPECTFKTNYGTTGSDFTIFVGDTLTISLVDKDGVKLTDVTFSVEENEYLTINDNGKITAIKAINKGIYVSVEYQGYTYKCLIRIYEKPEA